MKLGIAVVYLLREGNERFLEIHLDYIRKHTDCLFQIYGVPLRLPENALYILKNSDVVKLCDCKPKEVRGGEENAYYITQLIEHAIIDQCTHIALFHVDSFPIRGDWVQRMLEKVKQGFSLAAIRRDENVDYKPHSSFMFFPATYYEDFHPKFRLTVEETRQQSYKTYCKKFPHIWDTGHGIGYNLYMNHLSWYPLLRSNRREDHLMLGGIYDDMIFHFGAAAYNSFYTQKEKLEYLKRKWFLDGVVSKIAIILPGIEKFRSRLNPPYEKTKLYRRAVKKNLILKQKIKEKLFEDAESYIQSIL